MHTNKIAAFQHEDMSHLIHQKFADCRQLS